MTQPSMKPYHGGAKEDATAVDGVDGGMVGGLIAEVAKKRHAPSEHQSEGGAPWRRRRSHRGQSRSWTGGQLEDGMAVWKNVLEEQKKLCEPIEQLLSILLTMKEAQKQSDRKRLISLGKKHFNASGVGDVT